MRRKAARDIGMDDMTGKANSGAVSRRSMVASMGLGAAGAMLGGAAPVAAQPATGGGLIMKKLPRADVSVPAIGMGTYLTFDILPGRPRAHLGEIMRRFHAAGGRVIDTSPLYGMSEISVGDFANSLGIVDDLFVCNKVWTTGEYLGDDSHARRSLEQSRQRLWRDVIDVMQVHSLVNVDIMVPLLNAWKSEGRIRNVGVTHHELPYYGALANWVERGPVDFVQVRYSISTRQAEERILKAAADRGIAVLVNMPFEKAKLFQIVQGREVPDFARPFASTWAEFYLKWIISHPAVTCAIPATTNPEHLAANMGALRGALPDPDMRTRMVKHMETIPGFGDLASMPNYPGKTFVGAVQPPRRPAQPPAQPPAGQPRT